MTYNKKAIEQGQMRLALEHKWRMIAHQTEIDSVESIVLRSGTGELQILKKGGVNVSHEIEVRIKVKNVEGEIVFFVSDMPRVESSVKKNLANFDNWQYAKWTENGEAHCIYPTCTQVIVTMQNGAIEQVDYPTAKNESIMRIRIAYLVVCLYPNWQYVSWDWQAKLQILKREESKCRTQ